jgi:hypothetical protein
MQVGCPMNYDTLKEAIIKFKKSRKHDQNVPFSVVVISDKDWLGGGMGYMPVTEPCYFPVIYKIEVHLLMDSADTAQVDKQLAYTLLLAENICQKHDIKVSSSQVPIIYSA